MFKLKIDTAGLEATTLVTISYFLPLFVCLFLLLSTCPGFSSFNRFLNRFPFPHSASGSDWLCLVEPGYPVSQPPLPDQLCPPGLPSACPGWDPLPGPKCQDPQGRTLLETSGSWACIPLSPVFLWRDDAGPEACGKMGGGSEGRALGGGPGRHLGGIRLHRPKEQGTSVHPICHAPFLGPDRELGVEVWGWWGKPHSPVEAAT